MKRILCTLLTTALIFSLCACGTTEQPQEETHSDNYTYEQVKSIRSCVETELGRYGFKYSVYAYENTDGVIDITVDLSRAKAGAEETFVDTIDWSLIAVKTAKAETPFELGELRVTFLLYDGSLDGDVAGTMTYKSSDLEIGDVFCTEREFGSAKSKTGATAEEIREWFNIE